MSNPFIIEKLLALPTSFTPSTVYVIQDPVDPNFIELYVSSADGLSAKKIPGKADITTWINTAVATVNTGNVVADIAARDALAPSKVTFAVVLDATGDTTVLSGAATYVFDPVALTWTKIAEYESMDVVADWNSLINKPSSTVTAIDAAVAASHTHGNMPVLDKLGEDLAGNVTYNGAVISSTSQMVWLVEEW